MKQLINSDSESFKYFLQILIKFITFPLVTLVVNK